MKSGGDFTAPSEEVRVNTCLIVQNEEYKEENVLYKKLNFVGTYNHGQLIGPSWKPAYSLDGVDIGYYYRTEEAKLRMGNEEMK